MPTGLGRARPGARRRARARVAGAGRRRAGRRQELAAAAGAGRHRRRRHARRCSSAARSRRPRCGCAPSGWASPTASRSWPRPSSRRSCDAIAPSARTSCVVDSVQTLHSGRPGVGAGQRRPGAGGRRPPAAAGEARRHHRSCWSATSPRTARSPGPRVLEHLVDAVLQFEGDRYRFLRVLRAVKNRFGSTNEIGIFEMTDARAQPGGRSVGGVRSRPARPGPGSVLLPAIEGTRPILLEVQALVAPSRPGDAAPRRDRLRPQPAGDDPGGARPARRRRARLQRRLRQRGRRRADRRAGRRPGGGAGDRVGATAAGRPSERPGVLRRDRPDRPDCGRSATPTRGCARRASWASRRSSARPARAGFDGVRRPGTPSGLARCADGGAAR